MIYFGLNQGPSIFAIPEFIKINEDSQKCENAESGQKKHFFIRLGGHHPHTSHPYTSQY